MVCKRVVYVTECKESALIQVLLEYDKGNQAYLFLKPRRQPIPAAIACRHITALRIIAVELGDRMAGELISHKSSRPRCPQRARLPPGKEQRLSQ